MTITGILKQQALYLPHTTASVYAGRSATWAQLLEHVARFAAAIVALGARSRDRIAVLAWNSDRFLQCFFSIPWAGCVIVPLNTRWSAPELLFALRDCGARMLLHDASTAGIAAEIADAFGPGLVTISMEGEPLPGQAYSYDELITARSPAADATGSDHDLSGIFYTGGTTGQSKGVMLTHLNHVYNGLGLLAACRFPMGGITYLHVAPMFHVADALFVYGATMARATHVVIPRFEPDACIDAIRTYGITDTILVPTMIARLLDTLESEPGGLPTLKRLFYGAAPMPSALLARLLATLPDCEPFQLYGQTEAAPVLTFLDGASHAPQLGKSQSAGRPLPGVEIRIVDSEDREVPRGVSGEITARGANIMSGYWNRDEETARALRGGWLHTGDAGFMDEDGYVYLRDRIKDMIISGGENVYSIEVENAIYQHPGVAQCAVIGLPDPDWGERVHAVIMSKVPGGISAEELTRFLHGRIAGYKCPREFTFRTEPLPMSGAGKILKAELRSICAAPK